MQHPEPLDYLPLWALVPATAALVYGAIEIGYALGKFRRRAIEVEKDNAVGPVVGAMLGLLAFMLAFTFGLAATRFDARRQIVVDEANAIGTTHLRAGLLPDPYPAELRKLLEEYVRGRVEAIESGDIDRAMSAAVAMHETLWARAEQVAAEDRHSIATGLFIESLNETIDLHSKRVLIGVRSRIPVVVWLVLYLIAFLAMAQIGYQAGLAASPRSLAGVTFVLAFSVVISLIADLDRPHEGLISVSQEAIHDLQDSWSKSPSH